MERELSGSFRDVACVGGLWLVGGGRLVNGARLVDGGERCTVFCLVR